MALVRPDGRIGLGCMPMSFGYVDAPSEDDPSAVIERALDLGVAMFDTADVYGPFTNEELVGRALEGRRHEATIATKWGLVVGPSGGYPLVRDARPERAAEAVRASLERLGTDVIDLYYLHRVDEHVPLEESWAAMASLVEEGLVGAIGLSEVGVDELERAHAIHPVAAVQSELSLWTRDALDEVVPWCASHGAAFVPFSPLGRGFLTRGHHPWWVRRQGLPRLEPTLHRRGDRIEPGGREGGPAGGGAPRRDVGTGGPRVDARAGPARVADPRHEARTLPRGERGRLRTRAHRRRPGRARRRPTGQRPSILIAWSRPRRRARSPRRASRSASWRPRSRPAPRRAPHCRASTSTTCCARSWSGAAPTTTCSCSCPAAGRSTGSGSGPPLGERRLSLPDATEARAATGYERGAITPFGATTAWPVIAEASIRRLGTVAIGAGARGVNLHVDAVALLDVLGADEADVTTPAVDPAPGGDAPRP